VGQGAAAYADAFGAIPTGVLGPVDSLYPQASWIGRTAEDLLASGEPVAAAQVRLGGQDDDGQDTASALVGARLLAPEPLYLRRPDAVEPRTTR
jgi:hypothetical protein